MSGVIMNKIRELQAIVDRSAPEAMVMSAEGLASLLRVMEDRESKIAHLEQLYTEQQEEISRWKMIYAVAKRLGRAKK